VITQVLIVAYIPTFFEDPALQDWVLAEAGPIQFAIFSLTVCPSVPIERVGQVSIIISTCARIGRLATFPYSASHV